MIDGLTSALRLFQSVTTRAERMLGGTTYHAGPLFANQLGYQVARAVYKNAGWRLRTVALTDEIRDHVRTLEEDGILLLPDFFPAEVFASIRAEYETSRQRLAYNPWVVEDNDVVEEVVEPDDHPEAFPIVRRELVANLGIYSIISGALRRPIAVRPRTYVKRWTRADAPQKPRGPGHVVGANYLHADVHFPTFKAWLYLNDIDETNGAFVYAVGSHRMTLARLAYEYDASIRVAKKRTSESDAPYALVRTPSEEQLRRMNARLVPACGKANTLVIANTQGFHRQGDFEHGTVREKIMVCFRSAEPH